MIDLNKYYISTTYQGASGGSEGRAGFVPKALSGDELKFLRGDGTWQTLIQGGNIVTVGREEDADFICTGTQGNPIDHVKIQQAIESVSLSGGMVLIKSGTYYLSNTVNITAANIAVGGEGRSTQLLAVGDYGNVFYCALPVEPLQWPGMAGLQFSQLRFETTVARTNGAAIRANNTHNAIFRDLYICDTSYGISFGLVEPVPPAFYDGIYLDGQDQCHISKVTAQCSNYSVHVNGSGYGNADFSYDGYIENCDFFGVPGPTRVGIGIHLGSNCGGFVIDFVSMNQLSYGVYADTNDPVPTVQGGGILTIRGGYSENNTNDSYYIAGYQNVVIENLWGTLRTEGVIKLVVLGVAKPGDTLTLNNTSAIIYGAPASVSGTGSWIIYNNTGNSSKGLNMTLGTDSSHSLNLKTNSMVRASIDSAGNFGVGTSTPSERLTVSGNISATGIVYTNNDIEITNYTKGIILRSPNGNRWRTTITNSGTLSSVQI